MTTTELSRSERIRSKLSHPVIDCDGHWLPPMPVLLDYIDKVGGHEAAEAYRHHRRARDREWYDMTPAERLAARRIRPDFWCDSGKTLDRATGMLPKLMYERLDQFGIDFAVILPTGGPGSIGEARLRKTVARAMNVMHAEMFGPYSDRMTAVAVIPTHTPEEAIEEAEYASRELGLKVALINATISRPIAAHRSGASSSEKLPFYIDCLTLDSEFDYDPFWAKLVELKMTPMSHTGSQGWVDRSSPTSFVYNHLGHFAATGAAFAKGAFLDGLGRRFPELNFAVLECGVGWARILCCDLVAHWEKRNGDALRANLRPTNLDPGELRSLLVEHGGKIYERHLDEILKNNIGIGIPDVDLEELTRRDEVDNADFFDEFAKADVHSKEEVAEEFSRMFYFGCESDDPTTAYAFDKRLTPRMNAIFSSDISHFDVTDMTEVLEEAYELVEHGLIDEDDFKDFTFANPVRLHGLVNPCFFDGTVVEKAAKEVLAERQPAPARS